MSAWPTFFATDELCRLLGTRRKAKLRELLKAAGVPYVLDARGWPVVYRDRLLPCETQAKPVRFDFGRARP
jgi:hypothetical protein